MTTGEQSSQRPDSETDSDALEEQPAATSGSSSQSAKTNPKNGVGAIRRKGRQGLSYGGDVLRRLGRKHRDKKSNQGPEAS